MRTRPLKTCLATVAPISAAAILSRNEEITNTRTRSTKPPVQLSGRAAGIQSGMRLASKWRARRAKPTRSRNRFAMRTHSCCEMRKEACEARAFVEAGAQKLLERDGAEADESGGERMTMKNCDAGERGGEQQKIDQHGEIVSAEIRGDANGHVQGPAGFAGDSEGGDRQASVSIFVSGTKRTTLGCLRRCRICGARQRSAWRRGYTQKDSPIGFSPGSAVSGKSPCAKRRPPSLECGHGCWNRRRELSAAITTLSIPKEPEESTALSLLPPSGDAHPDPRDAYERTLTFLQADYFQDPDAFGDRMVSVFSAAPRWRLACSPGRRMHPGVRARAAALRPSLPGARNEAWQRHPARRRSGTIACSIRFARSTVHAARVQSGLDVGQSPLLTGPSV